MKKILFISSQLPYPITNGARVRTNSFIEALAADHELFLLYTDYESEIATAPELKKYFKKIWKVSYDPNKSAAPDRNRLKLLLSMVKLEPWEVQFLDPAFAQKILDIIAEEGIDIVFARYMAIAKYLIHVRKDIRARIIVDLDDIEPIKNERLIRASETPGSYGYWRKWLDNKMYERYHKKLNSFEQIFICSENDKRHIERKGWSRHVRVIPNSVDTAKYRGLSPFSADLCREKIILCCGTLAYGPNVEGLEWFLKDIWPTIIKSEPQAKLHMVGKDPVPALRQYADDKSVFLFPNVPSVLPYYEKAALSIAPLFIGGGTRIKILESFACRRPVVTTTIGAEGLDLVQGRECLLADEPEDFARACVRLLREPELGQKLVREGYRFVTEKYDLARIKDSIKEAFNGLPADAVRKEAGLQP